MSTAAPTASSTPLRSLDAAAARRWARTGCEALEQAREEIDDLNVYPVPDGDTGTNLHLTGRVARARGGAPSCRRRGVAAAAALAAMARGALLGRARELRGDPEPDAARARRRPVGGGRPAAPDGVARALACAADAAYAAVADLSRARCSAVLERPPHAAQEDAADGGLAEVVTRAAAGARAALDRTPDQLEVLRRAGVVDAGGRGVCVLLDALESVVTGALPEPGRPGARPGAPASRCRRRSDGPVDDGPGPAFEVMYLLDAARGPRSRTLRETLRQLGRLAGRRRRRADLERPRACRRRRGRRRGGGRGRAVPTASG